MGVGTGMRYLVSAMLVIVGIIHLLPLSGVLSESRLTVLYGIPFDEPNLEILMRHRAVLFGLADCGGLPPCAADSCVQRGFGECDFVSLPGLVRGWLQRTARSCLHG